MYLQVYIFLLPPLAARKAGDKGGKETEKGRKEGIKTGLGLIWDGGGVKEKVPFLFSIVRAAFSTAQEQPQPYTCQPP